MKYFLVFLNFLLFANLLLFADYYYEVNGRVNFIEVYYYNVSLKNRRILPGSLENVHYIAYDEKKRVIKEWEGKDNKNISWMKEYSYKNDVSDFKELCGKLEEKEDDDAGRMCAKKFKDIYEIKIEKMGGEDLFSTTLSFKDDNNTISYVLDLDYKVLEKIIKKFDGKNNMVEEASYNESGEINYKKVYSRDKFLTEIKEYDKNGILKSLIRKEYRTDGTLRKEVYNEYGYTQDLLSKKEVFYNSYGLKEEEKLYDSNNKIYKDYLFEYTLDKRGNWIIEIRYSVDLTTSMKRAERYVKRVLNYK